MTVFVAVSALVAMAVFIAMAVMDSVVFARVFMVVMNGVFRIGSL